MNPILRRELQRGPFEDLHFPLRGAQVAGEGPEERAFARSRGADEAEDLARLHREAQALEDLLVAEALGQVPDLDGGGHG
jgi:hypothetical protein